MGDEAEGEGQDTGLQGVLGSLELCTIPRLQEKVDIGHLAFEPFEDLQHGDKEDPITCAPSRSHVIGPEGVVQDHDPDPALDAAMVVGIFLPLPAALLLSRLDVQKMNPSPVAPRLEIFSDRSQEVDAVAGLDGARQPALMLLALRLSGPRLCRLAGHRSTLALPTRVTFQPPLSVGVSAAIPRTLWLGLGGPSPAPIPAALG
mmetsp:Transcript_7786/g.22105  ORF Transcript_7786/g.22105 Transcript_7786/m.22105 type:complete len:203 (-) Transcript_7786:280-888(-)